MSPRKKDGGFFAEFKKFALRGNVVDLAVGIVVGSAFTAIVNSLVNDIIMPVISLFTKGLSFNEWFIALDGNEYENLAAATKAGAAVLSYGAFVSAVLNFLIISFVVFIVIRFLNKIREIGKKEEPKEAPVTKECEFCKSEINIDATRCPHCTSKVGEQV